MRRHRGRNRSFRAYSSGRSRMPGSLAKRKCIEEFWNISRRPSRRFRHRTGCRDIGPVMVPGSRSDKDSERGIQSQNPTPICGAPASSARGERLRTDQLPWRSSADGGGLMKSAIIAVSLVLALGSRSAAQIAPPPATTEESYGGEVRVGLLVQSLHRASVFEPGDTVSGKMTLAGLDLLARIGTIVSTHGQLAAHPPRIGRGSPDISSFEKPGF